MIRADGHVVGPLPFSPQIARRKPVSNQSENGKGGEANNKVEEETAVETERLMVEALWQTRLKYEEIEGVTGQDGNQALDPVEAHESRGGFHSFVLPWHSADRLLTEAKEEDSLVPSSGTVLLPRTDR